MGVSVSRQTELSENELLQRFVGKQPIPIEDAQFWTDFLQYQIALPADSQEQLSLDSRIESLCQSFISHNLVSGNLGTLVAVFLGKVADLLELPDRESTRHVWHAFNALFIIRCLIKYIIETGSEYQLLQHFEAVPAAAAAVAESVANGGGSGVEAETEAAQLQHVDGSKFESFFDAVVSLIVVIPSKEFTYHLHLESVNLIVILFSLHQFSGVQQSQHHQQPSPPLPGQLGTPSEKLAERSVIFRTIYRNPNANMLMGALLHFVSRMVEVPPTMFGQPAGGSYVFGLADSLYSLLTFRKPATVEQLLAVGDDLPAAFRRHYPLANQSLLLLLILTNHCSTGPNAYRASLFGCADSQTAPETAAGAAARQPITFRIDFTQLFGTLCRIVTIDQATLLLYLLLHRNQRFQQFVMAQPDVQQLVVPILRTLYNAPDSTSHHIYMSLIVMLILSEDDGFNKAVHQIVLRNVAWYTERLIAEISLGGLLILVVIRTIQYNMIKMRDKYLHTNCLAALANMSGQFRSLHPYVAQRLVSLFETLAKKHARLEQRLRHSEGVVGSGGGGGGATVAQMDDALVVVMPAEAAAADGAATVIDIGDPALAEDMLQDLGVLEEVLRMVLEILNSCLSHQLVYCPNLVYTLLYKRHVFEAFRSQHAFQDIIQNIDMVVGFFSSRLQRVQDQRGELGVNEVLEVISKGASQWSSDRLRKFPDLKFKYVEEDAPEEFFIPYVWTLVSKYGCVHFSSETMRGVTTEIGC